MAHGVKTGGRKKGVKNKSTDERIQSIAASGETPLEYMLRVMRDENTTADRRDDMARAAGPYVHAKLASMEIAGSDGGPLKVELVSFADNPSSK